MGYRFYFNFSTSYLVVVQRMEPTAENFRFYIYVESKRSVPPGDILNQLHQVFGDTAPSQSCVYKWCKEFSTGGRQSCESLPHPGRPISQRKSSDISRVFDFVEDHPKATVRLIAASLQLSDKTVHRILVDDLLFRKVCSV